MNTNYSQLQSKKNNEDPVRRNSAVVENSGNSKNCINVYANSKAKLESQVKAEADQDQEQEQEINF
ncbi:hypothetical protein HF072_04995 [Bacillus sp. RO3]|nr:hypothetical protein [Bacillus sp. RO3]